MEDAKIRSSIDQSVTRWLHELQVGDELAAHRLWQFLHERLTLLAKREVGGCCTVFDEDDVAQSAFAAFCHAVQGGSYPEVADRGELWQLLAVITLNKARNKKRDQVRLRRGGGATQLALSEEVLEEISDLNMDPALSSLMQDECERLLSKLDRREVQLVALLKVEGYTNQEVAQQLGCTRRSVHRRLNLIRQAWAEELS